jgi:cytosine/adenosine deaminase-related metal-dependent hydrolase
MAPERILLRNIYHLVTRSGDGGSLERRRGVDLLIEGQRIADIGEGLPRGDATEIDASTKLVMPGLVNTHHHMYQTLQRNIPAVQDAKLFDWLVSLYEIWRHLTPETIRISTMLACSELIKTGCTTSMDHHYVFPQGVNPELIAVQLAAAEQVGIRFCATRGSMSRGKSKGGLPPDSVVQDEETILKHSEELIQRHHDPEPLAMARLALAPCSPFSVSEELMRQTAELARQHEVRLHTHLAETQDEESYCLEKYGCRPLGLMERLGWLGADVWFAHGIHFNDEEIELLAKTHTGVAHCPSSNMRLGSGIARVPEMLRKKTIPVGLAVDGSASNDTSDMMGEMRSCLLLHRVLGGAGAITAEQVLDLATRGGAALLGWPEAGSLEVGKAADVVLVEMDRLDYAGALSDPLAAVMFSGLSHQVHTVIVNGRVVLKEGALVNVDEGALRHQANQEARRMLELAGHNTQWIL